MSRFRRSKLNKDVMVKISCQDNKKPYEKKWKFTNKCLYEKEIKLIEIDKRYGGDD